MIVRGFLRCVPVVWIVSVQAVVPVTAKVWVVRPDGSGTAPTIQEAVLAASDGDTVRLAAGTFTGPGNRDIDFSGKAILVTSEGDPEASIIDCQSLGRGFVFDNGEGVDSRLSSLSVIGGDPANGLGGAIYVGPSASPTISDNVFRNNQASASGGAIFCDASSSPVISNNLFELNASGNGGALTSAGSFARVESNVLVDNRAANVGGGMLCSGTSSLVIVNNLFIRNSSKAGAGGGLICVDASPLVEGNTFQSNRAGSSGGGIACAGVLSAGFIAGNTLSENSAADRGGGIYCNEACPTVENSIIVFSTEGEGVACTGVAAPIIRCCNIFANDGGDDLCGMDGGGNFFEDPEFCGTLGSGDYGLRTTSPCLPENNGCKTLVGSHTAGCGSSPVERSTWGGIKARFVRERAHFDNVPGDW